MTLLNYFMETDVDLTCRKNQTAKTGQQQRNFLIYLISKLDFEEMIIDFMSALNIECYFIIYHCILIFIRGIYHLSSHGIDVTTFD
jgi:hypothetical protein